MAVSKDQLKPALPNNENMPPAPAGKNDREPLTLLSPSEEEEDCRGMRISGRKSAESAV